MTYPHHDYTVRTGNTGTSISADGIVAEFGEMSGTTFVPDDLTGSTFHFWAGDISKQSSDASITVDALNGKITIPVSIADVEAWKNSWPVPYEIERRVAGSQRCNLTGFIKVVQGYNLD